VNYANEEIYQLVQEHRALMGAYGSAQAHCHEHTKHQLGVIDQLQAQVIQLRAKLVACQSLLAWERNDLAQLKQRIPDLPARFLLVRQVKALVEELEQLKQSQPDATTPKRELRSTPTPGAPGTVNVDAIVSGSQLTYESPVDSQCLESSLRAADLVICQTGCVSHGDYWRVEDHCRRTGKTCVLVEHPDALRIVRIHSEEAATPLSSTEQP